MKSIVSVILAILWCATITFAQPIVEIEPNNNSSSATLISSGVLVQGGLFDANDRDFYRLSLSESQEVTLSVSTSSRAYSSLTSFNMKLKISVFNSNQVQIGGFTTQVSSELDTKLVAGPGDIIIEVSNDSRLNDFEGSLQYFLRATGSSSGGTIGNQLPTGPNSQTKISLDINVSGSSNNQVDDLITSATVDGNGVGTVFSTEIFYHNLGSNIVGTRLLFNMDLKKVKILKYDGPFTFASPIERGYNLAGLAPVTGPYVGTVTFEIISPIEGSLNIGIQSAEIAQSASVTDLVTSNAQIAISRSGNPATPVLGPNADTKISMDINVAGKSDNLVDDRVTSATINGSTRGATFSAEIFYSGLTTAISGTQINFRFDSSKVKLSQYEGPLIGIISENTLGAVAIGQTVNGPYIGKVTFEILVDINEPLTIGIDSATINVSSDISDKILTDAQIVLSKAQGKPLIVLPESELDFGAVFISDKVSKLLRIQNLGNSDLTVLEIKTDNPEFLISETSFTVGSGGHRDITITFEPHATGSKNANLTIRSNDPLNPSVTTILKGEASFPSKPIIGLSTNFVNFGTVVKVGSIGQSTFDITNSGSAPLSVSDVVIEDDSYVIVPRVITVDPGQSVKVTITFSPKTPGDHNGLIIITSNDPSNPQITLPVRATSPEAEIPKIEVNLQSLAFNTVDLGEQKTLEILVRNTGMGELKDKSVTISDPHFNVEQGTDFSLAGDGVATLFVTFTPTEAKEYVATLKIETNDPENGEVIVQLTGNGNAAPKFPVISILPAILNFGEVNIGQSKNLSLLVGNSGNVVLRVLNIVASSGDFIVSQPEFSIEPGKEVTLLVTFLPSQLGNINETLDIPTNDPQKPVIQIPIRATVKRRGEEGQISSIVSSIQFGEIGSFGVAEFNLPIRNNGSGTLNISNVVSSDLQVVVTPFALSIPPQETRSLTVRFKPRPGRERTGEIILNSDDLNQPRLRIPWEASVLSVPQLLSIESVTPKNGSSGVDLENEIAVRFSEPLLTNDRFVALTVSLFPQAESGRLLENFKLSNDKREIRFPVSLLSDTVYSLIVSDATGKSGAKLLETHHSVFSSGSILSELSSISGSVKLEDERGFEGTVVVFDGRGNLYRREFIRPDGSFSIEQLPSDDYRLFVDLFVEGIGAISAGFDENGDDEIDPVVIASGQNLSNIDFVIEVPNAVEPDTPSTPINTGVSATLDLNSSTANQHLNQLDGVQPGDEIQIAVYVENVTDLIGYSMTFAYDASQVSFKSIEEDQGKDERNILFSNNGSAAFIPSPPVEGKVQFAGAILGPTDRTAVNGNGLLGVLKFISLSSISEVDFRLENLILQAGSVMDTVSVNAVASVKTSSDSGTIIGEPGDEIPGFILVDLDDTDGNQGKVIKNGVKTGDTITLQLFADGFPEVIGFGVIIEFDKNSLGYNEQSFTVGDFIPGATPLATDKGGSIDAGAASLSGVVGSGDGYLGKLDFTVLDAYSDSTFLAVTIVGFSLKSGGIREEAIRVIARLNSEGPSLAGDFDGDGSVGFRDFLLFAQGFGGSDPLLDIDKDGSVGFRDFLTFAQNFGLTTKRLAKPSFKNNKSSKNAIVNITTNVSEDMVELTMDLQDFEGIGGLSTEVEFDPLALKFLEATTGLTSVFGGNGAVNINKAIQPGRLLLADIFEMDQANSGTELMKLRFLPLRSFNPKSISINRVSISDWEQNIVEIEPTVHTYTHQQAFLGANYPNPFNPVTQIPYTIPKAGILNLSIYNLLGQKVRTLVNSFQAKGDYVIDWDGRNSRGDFVASGVYIYRIKFDEYIDSRRMILLK